MFAIKWAIPKQIVYGVASSPIAIDPEIWIPSLESLVGIEKDNQNAQKNLRAVHTVLPEPRVRRPRR